MVRDPVNRHGADPLNLGCGRDVFLEILGPNGADTSPDAFLRGTCLVPLLDSQREGIRDGNFPLPFFSEINSYPFLPMIVSSRDAYFPSSFFTISSMR
jgi:hypothetical protein